MLKDLLGEVINNWKKQDISLAKPLSEEEIAGSFADCEILLSRDALEVYSKFGGFENDDLDDECMTFWTVEKIFQENEAGSEYVNFADFLIYSHLYAFKYKNAENSAIYACFGKNDRVKVADSFAEFFELYLKKIEKLFP